MEIIETTCMRSNFTFDFILYFNKNISCSRKFYSKKQYQSYQLCWLHLRWIRKFLLRETVSFSDLMLFFRTGDGIDWSDLSPPCHLLIELYPINCVNWRVTLLTRLAFQWLMSHIISYNFLLIFLTISKNFNQSALTKRGRPLSNVDANDI